MLLKLQPPPPVACVECRGRTLESRNRSQRYPHHQAPQKTRQQPRPQSASGDTRPWIVGKNVRPWSAGKDSRPPSGRGGGRYQNTDDVSRNMVSTVDDKSGGAKYVRRERRALPIVPPQDGEPVLKPPKSTEKSPVDSETKSTSIEGKNEEVPYEKVVEAEPDAASCADAASNDANSIVSHLLPASGAMPSETVVQ